MTESTMIPLLHNGHRHLQALALALCLSVTLIPLAYAGTVVRECSEGDICRVNDNTVFYTFHIKGIDAPELDQPYGKEARRATRKLLMNRNVELHCSGGFLQQKSCTVKDRLGNDVAAKLVEQGVAWDNPEESYGKYKSLQSQAKEAKVGLWADEPENIVSPYCWRTPSDKQCNDLQFQP